MALDLGKSFTELNPNLTRPQPTNPLAAKLNLESQQGLALERGPVGQPRIRTGTFGNLGDIQTSGTGAGDFAVRIGAAPTEMTTPSVFAMSHQLPTLQPVETPAPAIPTAPITTSTATPAPTTPTAPAAAKQVTAPEFMPTLSGPNTAQEMVSEGRNLMNTQGIGGFVQAKGLNRMAQTVNQANEPLIIGQYGLKREAMTANERLEQAKLAEATKNQQLMTPHVIAQEEEIDPLTGMSTRNKNIYGTYNPETKGWEPVKMPAIEKKAALPPKADLKAGQVYPGYGKWTGTGFLPQ